MSESPQPPRRTFVSSDIGLARRIARPLRTFIHTEAAGGIVLLGATLVALAVANSPFADSFEGLWRTELGFSVGNFDLTEDLRHFVNDALMALFFFVVGLEIKREIVLGELSDRRKAALPALAALGGMVVPALVYLLFNTRGDGAAGWGIPMATDIAFAVGVLAVLGNRVPSGLKIFLLSLAIVDDIGAILVIALFYSDAFQLGWLIAAIGLLAAVVLLRRLKVTWTPVYVLVGAGAWFATFESGIHATIAGVALGLLTPARPTDARGFKDVYRKTGLLSAEPDAHSLRAVSLQATEVVSVAERLEYLLHPWTSYLIIPLFALANAGVRLSAASLGDALTSRIALGIAAGLVLGKIVGISGAAWLAVKLNLARLPDGVSWRVVLGGAAVAGIGFTVSLFIAGLAFTEPGLIDQAKIGVLLASAIAGTMGVLLLVSNRASESVTVQPTVLEKGEVDGRGD
ncbi:MAG: Na+/H+ antiporter NhaA [Actinomycetota bacterium]